MRHKPLLITFYISCGWKGLVLPVRKCHHPTLSLMASSFRTYCVRATCGHPSTIVQTTKRSSAPLLQDRPSRILVNILLVWKLGCGEPESPAKAFEFIRDQRIITAPGGLDVSWVKEHCLSVLWIVRHCVVRPEELIQKLSSNSVSRYSSYFSSLLSVHPEKGQQHRYVMRCAFCKHK